MKVAYPLYLSTLVGSESIIGRTSHPGFGTPAPVSPRTSEGIGGPPKLRRAHGYTEQKES